MQQSYNRGGEEEENNITLLASASEFREVRIDHYSTHSKTLYAVQGGVVVREKITLKEH